MTAESKQIVMFPETPVEEIRREPVTRFYTQAESIINGRHIWFYLIATPIGNFHVVEYELPTKLIKRFLFDEHLEDAEKKYKSILCGMANGRM